MSSFATVLDNHISPELRNETYIILQSIKTLHSDPRSRHLAVPETACAKLPLIDFLKANGIAFKIADEGKHEVLYWDRKEDANCLGPRVIFRPDQNQTDKGELKTGLVIGSLKFEYEGINFVVYKITYVSNSVMGAQSVLYDFVFQDPTIQDPDSQETVGHNLISEVYRWAGSLKDEIWVFQNGSWSKDKDLWNSVRSASWDNLVLEPEFIDNLRRDTRTFFENSKIYQKLGVSWKRGLLLLGPPGNGKTETIKLLLKETNQATLYVKSFTTDDGPEVGVRSIFEHARLNAPCILVIEDLDSLVTSGVRSFFLNEIDGLGQNEGILTIATTNHPERIDDAILNRPSRFDVKYNFDLPTESLRTTYALKWIQKIKSTEGESEPSDDTLSIKFTKSDSELADEITKGTEGWSFAFLKELFVSFLLRVAHDKTRVLAEKSTALTETKFDEVLLNQMATLATQISSKNGENNTDNDEEDPQKTPAQAARLALRRMMTTGRV